MNTLELRMTRQLALPEDPGLLRAARLYHPTFHWRPTPHRTQNLASFRAALQSAGVSITRGVCHSLKLPTPPSEHSLLIDRWLMQRVLPDCLPDYHACAVSLNPQGARSAVLVVLLAQLA